MNKQGTSVLGEAGDSRSEDAGTLWDLLLSASVSSGPWHQGGAGSHLGSKEHWLWEFDRGPSGPEWF